MIRVLHVLPSGSGAPYFKGLARNFDRSRFEYDFVTLEDGNGSNQSLEELGARTHELGAGRGAFGLVRASARLRAFLGRERYDLIHLHLFPSLVAGSVARLLGAHPLVLASHHYGREPFLYRGNLPAQWMEKSFCRRLDHVIAVSQDIADYLLDEIGVPSERVSLIHYGFDFEELPAAPSSSFDVRGELGLDACFVVGSVARLHWTKGHRYLFEAAARLEHEDGVPVRVLLLGTGPEQKALEARARELGISEVVRFLGFCRDALPYYRAMDVFCHPSLQKGYEQVTVEAMALGKAVVGTPVGIAREILRDGETGLVVAERDSDSIYRALRRLHGDAELGRALGKRAAEHVRQVVPSRREMTRRYEEVYERLLERTAQGRCVNLGTKAQNVAPE